MSAPNTAAKVTSMPPGQPAFAMKKDASTSVTKPAAAQSATTTRDDLGSFTSCSAPPSARFDFQIQMTFQVEPFQVDPFQVEPFQVEPFQVEPFQVEPFQVEPFQVEPFQVEPFQVEPFQVEPFHDRAVPGRAVPGGAVPGRAVQFTGFHDDKAPAASMLTVCPI